MQSRSSKKEQLDNLSLSGVSLIRTLQSLKFINTFFGNHSQLKTAVYNFCKLYPRHTPIRIVDLGCGGGDSLFAVATYLEKKGIQATFIGIDGNANSIHYAQQQATSSTITFLTADILDPNFSLPECDLLISSHFIYHFENSALITFIQQLKKTTITHLIFSELRRSYISYRLFQFLSPILPISQMAKADGLLALQRTFSMSELHSIINSSNVTQFSLKKRPWFRMLAFIKL